MIRLAAIMLAMAIAMPATAQDTAPKTTPRPMPRPEDTSPQTTPPENTPPENTPTVAPQPTDEKTGAETGPPPSPHVGQRNLLRLDDAAYATCRAALAKLSVVSEDVAPIAPAEDADCGILQPVKVTQIAPGVALIPPAVIRCPTALALAAWVQDFVLPASARLKGRGALTAIENGSGYICRRRNNLADGALSEHAFGNAFDVMGFRFEQGPALMIGPTKPQDSLASAFQDAVRATACLDFSTVLGPGSNSSHDDHLHLDIMARDNGFRLCELGGAVQQ